jgi:hypothetical protein
MQASVVNLTLRKQKIRMRMFISAFIWLGIVWMGFSYKKSPAQTTPGVTNAWTETERTQLVRQLADSRQLLLDELREVRDEQWSFKPSPDSWSIAEVVEHLGLQQDAYYRELTIVTQMPPMPQYRAQVQGLDEKIRQYTHQQQKDAAPWLLEPLGRWCSPEKAVAQFVRSHGKIIEFIQNTQADFRNLFTFRQYSEGSLWNIRDLHQLMLTNVAHTERHVHQIRTIKQSSDYPN